MKERPIIMQAHNVRAILDGRKTQTRRIVKPQPHSVQGEHQCGGLWLMDYKWHVPCPYGVPGDRLWVRETWAPGDREPCDCLPTACTHYPDIAYRADWGGIDDDVRWNSPIHMPRWASRILLELTAVRVERVQDISPSDAEAEVAPTATDDQISEAGLWESVVGLAQSRTPRLYGWDFAQVGGFAVTWDAINGKGSWASNPWTWCLTFIVVDAKGGAK